MSANFYALLKYAATGVASPDMTYYDRLRASTLMGGVVQTLTGQPPLTFKADGTPLISWSMKGNGQQTGTPSPDNIIMPTFCGVRTANVIPAGELKTVSDSGITFESDGKGRYHIYGTSTAYASARFYLVSGFTTPISISNGGQGTLSFFNSQATSAVAFSFYNGGTKVDDWKTTPQDRASTSYNVLGNKYVNNVVITVVSGSTVDMIISPEFTNDGILPSGFEPYGWAEKITNAGQTVPVYLGTVPTVRRINKLVCDGNEPWMLSGNIIYISNTDTNRMSPLICTHFPNVQNTGMWNGNNWIFQVDISTLGMTGRDAWIAYLRQQYAAGTPVTIWYVLANEQTAIVNEPLCKIGNYADELHSTDAAVTIPTSRGQNTLTVETELQPSEMSITYRG